MELTTGNADTESDIVETCREPRATTYGIGS